MKYLSEKQVREKLKDFPYTKQCDTFELMEFCKRLYLENEVKVKQLKKYTEQILLNNWNGDIKIIGQGEKDRDGILMSVDITIGGKVCNRLNFVINNTMIEFIDELKVKSDYYKNLFDSMNIAYCNKLT